MSLTPNELDIIKQQLGYSLPRLGAEPWITYTAIFDRVIQPYLFDNSTTVAAAITTTGQQAFTVATNPVAPNNSALLTFAVPGQIVVDIGSVQEITTLFAITGTTFTASFANLHPAGFTIWPNGAEWAVRGILARIATIETSLYTIAPKTAGIAQADEIKFFAASKSGAREGTRDPHESLVEQRNTARDDLAAAVGVTNLWRVRGPSSGPTSMEAY